MKADESKISHYKVLKTIFHFGGSIDDILEFTTNEEKYHEAIG